MKSKVQNRQLGFTLIELLVVVSIIALLVSILMPALSRAREQAKFVLCKTQLKSYGLAAKMYVNNNDDRYTYSRDSIFREDPRGNRNCQWHDGRYDYPANEFDHTPANIQGSLWSYLESSMDIHLCPTFMNFANAYGKDHPGHDNAIPIDPQYSYSQNNFLGRSIGVYKDSQVQNPSEVFVFVEETIWRIPGFASHVLNDTVFWSRHPKDPAGFEGDCIATYHNTNLENRNDGDGNAVFADGHVELKSAYDSRTLSWGTVSASFRYSWPKSKIPQNNAYW